MIRILVCMWPDFCAGRGFNHVRLDKMHDYVVNLDKGERIVLAYTMQYVMSARASTMSARIAVGWLEQKLPARLYVVTAYDDDS